MVLEAGAEAAVLLDVDELYRERGPVDEAPKDLVRLVAQGAIGLCEEEEKVARAGVGPDAEELAGQEGEDAEDHAGRAEEEVALEEPVQAEDDERDAREEREADDEAVRAEIDLAGHGAFEGGRP